MVSPNDLLSFAKAEMIDGREPSTRDDWMRVVNCIAANLAPEAAQPAMRVIAMIYDIPLSAETIEKIVDFQIERKK